MACLYISMVVPSEYMSTSKKRTLIITVPVEGIEGNLQIMRKDIRSSYKSWVNHEAEAGEPLRSEALLWPSQSSSPGLRRAAIATASAVCLHSVPPSDFTVGKDPLLKKN